MWYPRAVLLSNRSAAQLSLQQARAALRDARACLELEPHWWKVCMVNMHNRQTQDAHKWHVDLTWTVPTRHVGAWPYGGGSCQSRSMGGGGARVSRQCAADLTAYSFRAFLIPWWAVPCCRADRVLRGRTATRAGERLPQRGLGSCRRPQQLSLEIAVATRATSMTSHNGVTCILGNVHVDRQCAFAD